MSNTVTRTTRRDEVEEAEADMVAETITIDGKGTLKLIVINY